MENATLKLTVPQILAAVDLLDPRELSEFRSGYRSHLRKRLEAAARQGDIQAIAKLLDDESLGEPLDRLLSNYAALQRPTAIELFRQDRISLERGAELAGVSLWDFKDLLTAEGVEIVVYTPPVGMLDAMVAEWKTERRLLPAVR
ncbi:MAG: UPF0175 family protein [Chloroflexi bacterium]|nr:UPF0175 family protein [Chloroflexota bacterium]